MRLPTSIILAYLEVPELATLGPTEIAIAISDLVNTKRHKKQAFQTESREQH